MQAVTALVLMGTTTALVAKVMQFFTNLANVKCSIANKTNTSLLERDLSEKTSPSHYYADVPFIFALPRYYIAHAAVIVLPQLGMLHALVLSWVYNWNEVVDATCEMPDGDTVSPYNLVPSISACIGHSAVNRQVWGMYIGWYIGLRAPSILVFLYSYAPTLWNGSMRKGAETWLTLKFFFHLCEQMGLLGLTVVSSSENLLVHQIFFVIYWLASICCLAVTTYTNFQALRSGAFTGLSATRLWFSFKWRVACYVIHLLASVSALYWYFAHETYCRNFFYTFFALSEWTLVFSNVYFHVAEICEACDLAVIYQRNKRTSENPGSELGNGSGAHLRRSH